jgi:uncharacterized protein (DUF1501 family)
MKRRDFLKSVTLLPLGGVGVAFAAASATYENLLILVELKGGNDGLNTVVPYADDAYYRLRPRIAVARDQVIQLSTTSGLNPALAPLMPLWESRELAIVQGLGYPDPNLSHFRSIEIWDTASRSSEYLSEGWLARAFEQFPAPTSFAADGIVVGAQDLGPLDGGSARAIALTNRDQFTRQSRLALPGGSATNKALAHILKVEDDIHDAAGKLSGDYVFQTEFPAGPFGNAIKTACQVAATRSGMAVARLTLNGFDTHSNQPATQSRLLKEFADGMASLKAALTEIKRWDSTLVITYAEFGRRPRENLSNGTDHGTANAHFVLGGRVQGGLYGEPPRLDRLDGNGNLAYAVDFRSVYATALEKWWGVSSRDVLGGRFAPLEILRST